MSRDRHSELERLILEQRRDRRGIRIVCPPTLDGWDALNDEVERFIEFDSDKHDWPDNSDGSSALDEIRRATASHEIDFGSGWL